MAAAYYQHVSPLHLPSFSPVIRKWDPDHGLDLTGVITEASPMRQHKKKHDLQYSDVVEESQPALNSPAVTD